METVEPGLRDLRAFCRVVDLGSVTAAAATLGETKGAVSRRLARLEAAVGVALLVRGARRVRPTEEGRRYRERAGRALELLDEAAVEVGGPDAAPAGRVRVTAAPDLGEVLLAPVLGEVHERFPAVSVEALLTDAVLPFAENGLDLALRVASTLPDSALVGHRLGAVTMALVASPAWVAREGPLTHPSQLAAHPVLSYRRARGVTARLVRPDGEAAEIVLDPKLLANDGRFLAVAAIGGAGVAALPEFFVRADLAAGRLVRVLPEWSSETMGKAWLLHAGGPLPAAVRAVRDVLRARAQGLLEGRG